MSALLNKQQVLVVDDDKAVGTVLCALLVQSGYQAHWVGDGVAALAFLSSRRVDVVLSDVRMPSMDGLELLAEIKKRELDVPVILLTAHGTVSMAVDAMKAGAADFLQKPFDKDEIVFVIGKALQQADHRERTSPSAPSLAGTLEFGVSEKMRALSAMLDKVAPSDATVLLRGESGSGKEVIANAIHTRSGRKGPLVAVHCGALPENLLESELFGYEKGAFTGAIQRKPGRFELAEGGTLFLDEIAEVALPMQAKLLRVLQERELTRLGGTQTLKVNVRILAATHRDLEKMVKEGLFREDLFYRLNVVPLELPSLRERTDDVEYYARKFVAEFAAGEAILIDAAALATLRGYRWPGNVRELRNVCERLVIFRSGQNIAQTDVETQLQPSAPRISMSGISGTHDLGELRDTVEQKAIENALLKAKGNRTRAARLLGVSRRTLYNKLAELNITT